MIDLFITKSDGKSMNNEFVLGDTSYSGKHVILKGCELARNVLAFSELRVRVGRSKRSGGKLSLCSLHRDPPVLK